MGRLLCLAGGYSCSWMVTNDPGVTLPPHRGRVSGIPRGSGGGYSCSWVPLALLHRGDLTDSSECLDRGETDGLCSEVTNSSKYMLEFYFLLRKDEPTCTFRNDWTIFIFGIHSIQYPFDGPQRPPLLTWFGFNPAWIGNYIHYKM